MMDLREVMMGRGKKNPAFSRGSFFEIRATLGGSGSFDIQYFDVKVECFSR